MKRLGYDKAREEEEARAVKQREEEERRRARSAGEQISRGSTPAGGYGGSGAKRDVDDAPKPARLGFGQVVGAAPVVQNKPCVYVAPSCPRDRGPKRRYAGVGSVSQGGGKTAGEARDMSIGGVTAHRIAGRRG